MREAVKVTVRGRVQGVGFRPFVFQLAESNQLKGTVQNNMDGVKIHIEGEREKIQLFLESLQNRAPRLSRIDEVLVALSLEEGFTYFSIIPSERSGASTLVIPVDSAVCDECLDEMNDPANFRYQYPFINCTQCGPRYTIINALPYDRPYTSMNGFPMCEDCRMEYADPTNRRHHAQPIACPKCGPKVRLFNCQGVEIDYENPIKKTINLLKEGRIVAIKGLGGYHLCCDARNEHAVENLRKRKNRPARALAVMAGSMKTVKDLAVLSLDEANLLKSPEAPIVVLKKSDSYHLAENVAPGMKTIGMMLPYTPLHHLLFSDPALICLVMTSANPSGMPILYKDVEAFQFLNGIADYFLMHNREILHPLDDSVVQINAGKLDFLRRSRGYVPDPFITNKDVSGIIALGGQQKSSFTIGRNRQIFVGQHIGDLENVETVNHYQSELGHLLRWVDTPKDLAVIDKHHDYHVQKLVKEYGFKEVMEVQHHHAHMAACIDEHQIEGKVFGIILDGTGYGLDGNIWGFEILYGDTLQFERMAHLHYTPLPGSEKCIREPWRNAVAMLISLHRDLGVKLAKSLFIDKGSEIDILKMMIEKNLNTVYAGTCGRLFDAVSAICGITRVSSFDGEAAIKLSEQMEEKSSYEPYCFEISKSEKHWTIHFSTMIKEIAEEVLAGRNVEKIIGRFHETIVQATVSTLDTILTHLPSLEKSAVLSGGSFHNRYLRKRISDELRKRDYAVFVPERVPGNDGGLSYGQLVIGVSRRRVK